MYAVNDPRKSKYKLLIINRKEKEGTETLKNLKAFLINKQLMMFMKIWNTIIQHRKREY